MGVQRVFCMWGWFQVVNEPTMIRQITVVHVFENRRVILEDTLTVGTHNNSHRDYVLRVECVLSSSEIPLATCLFPIIMLWFYTRVKENQPSGENRNFGYFRSPLQIWD